MGSFNYFDPLRSDRPEIEVMFLKRKLKELQDFVSSEKRKFMEQFVLNKALSPSNADGDFLAEEADKAWVTIKKLCMEVQDEQHQH